MKAWEWGTIKSSLASQPTSAWSRLAHKSKSSQVQNVYLILGYITHPNQSGIGRLPNVFSPTEGKNHLGDDPWPMVVA